MKNMKNFSLDEIRKKYDEGEARPTSPTAQPADLPEGFWDRAEVVTRGTKKSVHLRIDPEVWEFFYAGGKGHLTRMNDVLRSYVAAQKNRSTTG